ncbi:MAG: acyl-CoA dehydrogenase family protein [Deltaproteobacteria bacterium]|nr:acyl-CoA dehydrogenase family protein [Deltaproteobacteria bacterium]
MSFDLTREQKDIQEAAREFAETELNKDYVLECEQNHKFPWEVFQKAADLGFVGIDIPKNMEIRDRLIIIHIVLPSQ